MLITLSDAVSNIRLLTNLNVACISILVFDYLLTFSDEIEYVWSSKWNAGKILYFLIRYPVLLDIFVVKVANLTPLSPRQCQMLVYTVDWLFTVGIGVVAVMLALRTWIIWHRNKRIGWVLGALLTLLWIAMLLFAGFSVSAKTEFYHYPENIRNMGCLILKRDEKPHFYLVVIVIGVFEICIFILTCARIYRSSWSRRILSRVTGAGTPQKVGLSSTGFSPVVSVLYRDALLNYVLLLVLVNLALLSVTPVRTEILAPAALGWQRTAHAIFGSRTLLHMRKANQVRFDTSKQSISTIRFRLDLVRGGEGHAAEVDMVPKGRFDKESWFTPLSESDSSDTTCIPLSSMDSCRSPRGAASPR